MKYLVNRTTKEHRIAGKDWQDTDTDYWRVVQADSEGWLPHTGKECPLPDDVRFEYRMADGEISEQQGRAGVLRWTYTCSDADITHYKPILAEKAQEPAPKTVGIRMTDSAGMDLGEGDFTSYGPVISVVGGLLCRLKAAHKAAQQIPDLEKELREVLAGMGYTLGKLSPFVEPEPAVETPQDNKYAAEW